jgi:hypothetical protein
LADHLLLIEDDTKLLIFHHASFLEYHRKYKASLPCNHPSQQLTKTTTQSNLHVPSRTSRRDPAHPSAPLPPSTVQ